MFKTFFYLFIMSFISSGNLKATEPTNNEIWLIKYKAGDSLKWASSKYNDEYWDIYYDEDESIQTDSQYIWLRVRVLLTQEFVQEKNIELLSILTGSYEVFWNGNLIGKNYNNKDNFHISNRRSKVISQINIPNSLIISQSNLLAFRIAKRKSEDINIDLIQIDSHNFNVMVKYIGILSVLLFLVLFIFISIFFLKKARKNNFKIKYVILTSIAILFSLWALVFIINVFLNLNHIFYYSTYLFESVLWKSLLITAPIYFAYEFEIPYKKFIWLITGLFLFLSLTFFNNDLQTLIIFSLVIVLIILAYAIYKKKYAGYFALFGTLSIFLFIIYGSVNNIFLFGILIFALVIIIDISKESIYQRIQYLDTKLKSSQLETELYKKFIQPHYILNSLNTVIEWLEEKPAKGIEFIQALSEEFHTLSSITNKKLITMKEELDICKAHLKIMSYRKSINYILETNNINEFERIPPAIIHTLIENGITHNSNNKIKEIKFTLTEIKTNNCRKYILTNSNFSIFNSTYLSDKESNGFGIGFKYIKSRLKESYGNNWQLSSEQVGNDWTTVIEIFN